jgi:predicted DNA-binding transcriptional regulator YafY
MSRPTARVLAALELLQTHGRMSGSELARRLQVDPRTVRRYVVTLEELGIPVTAERGRDGHYDARRPQAPRPRRGRDRSASIGCCP